MQVMGELTTGIGTVVMLGIAPLVAGAAEVAGSRRTQPGSRPPRFAIRRARQTPDGSGPGRRGGQ